MEKDTRADAYVAQRDRNVLEIEKRKEELRLRTCSTELDKTCQPKNRGGKVSSCVLQFFTVSIVAIFFLLA